MAGGKNKESQPQVRWTNAVRQKALMYHRDNNDGLLKNSTMGTSSCFDTREDTKAKILAYFRDELGQFFHPFC